MTVVIAILSGPVGIVIAIAAVIAAGIALWKNWDKVKAKALELKNKVVQTFTTLKQNTIDKFNEIKNKIKEKIQDARDQAVQKVQDMKDKVVQKFTDIKDKAKEKFDDIKNSIKEKIEWARDKVQAAIDKIKGFFNFKWSLPKLKLPHFSISGSFSLNPPSVPHLSVDWYKTAMGNGMIFTNPTIFGMANGRMQGAGDAGPELLIGMSSLERMIREATASSGADPSVIYSAVKAGMQDADIGIYLMDRQVGRTLRDMGVAFNG
jgi:F0F1-type ATP synthase membrane subunit b/b'